MSESVDKEKFELCVRGKMREISVHLKNAARARNFKMWVADSENLILSKPRYAPKSEALSFLKKNTEWIAEQIGKWKPKVKLSAWIADKQTLCADGRDWKVWVEPTRTKPFFVADDNKAEVVFLSNSEENLHSILIKFAAEKLSRTALEVAERANLSFKKISVRDQSGRWASMSTSGTLSVNWRVILLPAHLQNYIFSHELAHTKFMDHSVSFWIFLNKICPNARRLDDEISKISSSIFSIE